ncbi:MAG TPA: vanadium-dependent haloperoxidase, partial [Chloroflexota bacterium]|nr:vanadium-dependent haloperoxidase [Chloroflexota bacterium]
PPHGSGSITGRYELYKWTTRGPADASPQAAAAAAAHRMLLSSFGHVPAARARLADAYAASLAKVPSGAAKDQGVRYGERAADRILALRIDDGRFGTLRFTMPLAPGVWRPTPPAMAPFFGPWLSRLRPMLLTTDGQETNWGGLNANPSAWGAPRNPDGTVRGEVDWWTKWRAAAPPTLTSAAYAADFNEVKTVGSKNSAVRTAAQTETALFINPIAPAALQAALRDLVTRRGMDISDSARLFAAVNMSVGDAGRVTWDNKFHYGLWRPITAIQLADTDGNAGTEADPTWEPLIVNPPYPDYTSGLNSVTSSASRALARVLGTDRIDLYITSTGTGTPITRHYATADALCRDAMDARVWAGIHFRFADTAADDTGKRVADWALDHYFRPTAA